jgi:hypothetical protein
MFIDSREFENMDSSLSLSLCGAAGRDFFIYSEFVVRSSVECINDIYRLVLGTTFFMRWCCHCEDVIVSRAFSAMLFSTTGLVPDFL